MGRGWELYNQQFNHMIWICPETGHCISAPKYCCNLTRNGDGFHWILEHFMFGLIHLLSYWNWRNWLQDPLLVRAVRAGDAGAILWLYLSVCQWPSEILCVCRCSMSFCHNTLQNLTKKQTEKVPHQFLPRKSPQPRIFSDQAWWKINH